jgi:RNA recognition motif-containing protein
MMNQLSFNFSILQIMSRHQEWDPMCKVYIGGLRSDSNKFDIEDAFKEFGKVTF